MKLYFDIHSNLHRQFRHLTGACNYNLQRTDFPFVYFLIGPAGTLKRLCPKPSLIQWNIQYATPHGVAHLNTSFLNFNKITKLFQLTRIPIAQ